MGVVEMSEECRRAFQASLELLEEKCGVLKSQEKIEETLRRMLKKRGYSDKAIEEILALYGGRAVKLEEASATVRVPEEVEKLATANPELTREERIKAVAESEWARGWAKGMVGLVSPGLVGAEREEAIERLSRTLAERVV